MRLRPEKYDWSRYWKNYKIIFNDKGYSAIWGNFSYYGNTYKSLGIRDNVGNYPKGKYGKPKWFVIPDFLTLTVLETLLTISLEKEKRLKRKKAGKFSSNIRSVISEFINK